MMSRLVRLFVVLALLCVAVPARAQVSILMQVVGSNQGDSMNSSYPGSKGWTYVDAAALSVGNPCVISLSKPLNLLTPLLTLRSIKGGEFEYNVVWLSQAGGGKPFELLRLSGRAQVNGSTISGFTEGPREDFALVANLLEMAVQIPDQRGNTLTQSVEKLACTP